ncbi:hypothetical protein MIC97_04720 [Aquamicrobium sp. NLF2-7]|uniref:hypothetical protein n=1 Tax=unclassified Aquamicrobium TaxID=2618194 RepID=UPI001EFBA7A0|nr:MULTISPECIES: hypothetical protein [unclassified Aquamicrobium]MCG8270811.1 hypothetical protein [Aquamicrobium sp. NLF2-7]MCK9554143.1 hypothetical protein [Aquamicrobium sp.]
MLDFFICDVMYAVAQDVSPTVPDARQVMPKSPVSTSRKAGLNFWNLRLVSCCRKAKTKQRFPLSAFKQFQFAGSLPNPCDTLSSKQG